MTKIINHPRYDLGEIIGQGTWGNVYDATDTATGENVALKALNPTPLAREQMKQRHLTPFEAMRKEGGIFRWGKNPEPWSFYFDESSQKYRHQYAYQVTRADFDKILLDHAKLSGVKVINGKAIGLISKGEGFGDNSVVMTELNDDENLPINLR